MNQQELIMLVVATRDTLKADIKQPQQRSQRITSISLHHSPKNPTIMKTFNLLSFLSLLIFISFAAHIDATGTAASSARWLRIHNELESSFSSSSGTRGVGWFGKARPTFLQRQEEPYPIASLMSSVNTSVAEEKDDEFTSDDALAFTWIGFALAFMLKNF